MVTGDMVKPCYIDDALSTSSRCKEILTKHLEEFPDFTNSFIPICPYILVVLLL